RAPEAGGPPDAETLAPRRAPRTAPEPAPETARSSPCAPSGLHFEREKRSAARFWQRRQTDRLKITTMSAITHTLAARRGKSATSAARLICAPRPTVASVSPRKLTASETMLAFQAPPAAVTQPVTRYGKTAGAQSVRKVWTRESR